MKKVPIIKRFRKNTKKYTKIKKLPKIWKSSKKGKKGTLKLKKYNKSEMYKVFRSYYKQSYQRGKKYDILKSTNCFKNLPKNLKKNYKKMKKVYKLKLFQKCTQNLRSTKNLKNVHKILIALENHYQWRIKKYQSKQNVLIARKINKKM